MPGLLCEVCQKPYVRLSGLSPAGLAFEHADGTVHERQLPRCPCCQSPYVKGSYCMECVMKHECELGTGHALLDDPTRAMWVGRHRARGTA